jgi:hypothetical protein
MTDYKRPRRVIGNGAAVWPWVVLVLFVVMLSIAGESDYQSQVALAQPVFIQEVSR